MKRKIGMVALLTLMTIGALATTALAQCGTGVLLKWDGNAFAYESSYNAATFHSDPGSQLVVVGKITLFCSPFQDLDTSDPTREYTFLWAGLTSAGTLHNPVAGGGTRHQTDYGSGVFFIYEDTSPDTPGENSMPPNPPNAQVPSTYVDGTLILEGNLTNFQTTVTRFNNGNFATSFLANYQFTGPALSPYYQRIQGSLADQAQGTWCATGSANGLCGIPAGYSAHPNGKFDQPPPTPTQTSTWGSIKQLYR
jgi:hypothetical protein